MAVTRLNPPSGMLARSFSPRIQSSGGWFLQIGGEQNSACQDKLSKHESLDVPGGSYDIMICMLPALAPSAHFPLITWPFLEVVSTAARQIRRRLAPLTARSVFARAATCLPPATGLIYFTALRAFVRTRAPSEALVSVSRSSLFPPLR